METVGLGIYFFMFPVIAAVVLGIIWRAVYREFRQERDPDEMV